MCVVSMIMDHFHDKWQPYVPTTFPYTQTYPPVPVISQEEVNEFRRLLERAREYDKRNNEPDCEMEAKRKAIKDIADRLGVDISFL
jgi:hypothetical protein